MGRIIKCHNRRPFRPTPYPIPSKRYALEKIDWEQAICSVCLEAPHNAVLLLCSSHDKGCRPYMCGTSFRHSNCLDLFKKAYAKPAITSSSDLHEHLGWTSRKKSEPTELSCPLCRGEVKGWTVVNPARQYLNRKKRSCVQEECSFTGTYRELNKHMKAKHRRAKPRKVDPVLEAKWRAFEMRTAQQDVLSTIRSSMPGAVVMGDYVLDMASDSSDDDDEDDEDERAGFDGDRGEFLRGRENYMAWRSLFLFIQEMQRDGAMFEEGGTSGTAVNYQSEGDGVENGDDRIVESPVNSLRDGRRRRRGRSRLSRASSRFR